MGKAKGLIAKISGAEKPKEEVPKNEAEHDAQVNAGLATLDKEQQKEDKDHNGALTRDEAVEAAQKVKAAYPVFKSITPVEQGGRWVFEYVASPKKVQAGLNAEDFANIYKLNPNEVRNALKNYIQLDKKRALFKASNGLELEGRAQRSLDNLSDKQLIFQYKNKYSPQDTKGDIIILNYHEQSIEGPIIEMPSRYHKNSNIKQHPLGNKGGVGANSIDRTKFNIWREEYWSARYAQEMIKRELIK